MTRAAPDPVVVVASAETAATWALALNARGIPARACTVSRVAPPEPAEAPARALEASGDALVLATSANAVRFLPAGAGRGRRAAAVGAATARALRRAGFRVEVEGIAGAEEVARRLLAGPAQRVLWLRADRAREEGAAALRAAGWTVEEAVAYRALPHEAFAACVAEGPARAFVLGSPRAFEDLVAQLRSTGREGWLAVPLVAVGATTLRCVVARGLSGGVAATAPTAEAVAASVAAALRGA